MTRQRVSNAKMIDTDTRAGGYEVKAEVGSVIRLDEKNYSEVLLEGEDFVDSGFPGCDFRFPVMNGLHKIAVNIMVTGRTSQYRDGARWVRVKIEWVGDCEPSTFSGGWMKV